MESREFDFRQLPTICQRGKKCQVCGKMCSDDTSLDSHYSLLHPEMKLICLKCPNIIMFSSMSALKNHYNKHGSKIPELPPMRNECSFGCTLCNHVAPTKEKLGDHVRTAHSYYCRHRHCSFKTTSKEALHKHFSATHEFRCSVMKCSFIAESKDKLNTHINDVHMHRCELCSFRSPQENVLRIHVRKMHVEKIRCGQCTMLVPKSEISSHKMMKHGSSNGGQESPRTLSLQKNLIDESDLKSGTRKLYPCPECKVNFSSLDAMKEHVKTRHKKQVEVIYKCPKNRCTYQTSNRLQMQRHQKEQHSSERSNVPVKVGPTKPISFDCQFCDFNAKSMELLREHRSIHLQKPQDPEEEVPLEMEVTSEDVPPPIEMEVTSEDVLLPIEKDVTGEDMPPLMEKEVNNEDVPSSIENGVTSNDVPPSLEKVVTSKEVPPPIEMEVTSKDVLPPIEKDVTGEDMPPLMEKEVTNEDVPSSIKNVVTSKDMSCLIEKEVTNQDVPPPMENEVTNEDLPPSIKKVVTSKDVPPPIEKEVTKENVLHAIEKEVTDEDRTLRIGAVDSKED